MQDNEGFKFLKEAFEKFAAKYDGGDITGRAARSLASGGKAAIDQGMEEFPKPFVNQVIKDIYSLLTSQELADGISSTVRSFDEGKVKDMVDGLVSQLKDSDQALELATKLKTALDKLPVEDITQQLDGLLASSNLPMEAQLPLQMFISQLGPILESIKNDSPAEIADKLSQLADNIPTDLIAGQVGEVTRNITPENISKKANDFVGKLPSSQAVSDVIHGLGGEISDQLERMTKIQAVEEIKPILSDLADNARQILAETLNKDNAAKKTFNKKGGKKYGF